MKRYVLPMGLVLVLFLSGCSDSPQSSSFSDSNETSPKQEIQSRKNSTNKSSGKENPEFPIKVGTIDSSEPKLFGCGTSLWRAKTNPEKDGILFSDRGGEPLMVFNNEIVNLKKKTTSSKVDRENYGIFTTEDGAISVQVNFTIGELLNDETRSIPEGIITIQTQGKTQDIAVTGDTGC